MCVTGGLIKTLFAGRVVVHNHFWTDKKHTHTHTQKLIISGEREKKKKKKKKKKRVTCAFDTRLV